MLNLVDAASTVAIGCGGTADRTTPSNRPSRCRPRSTPPWGRSPGRKRQYHRVAVAGGLTRLGAAAPPSASGPPGCGPSRFRSWIARPWRRCPPSCARNDPTKWINLAGTGRFAAVRSSVAGHPHVDRAGAFRPGPGLLSDAACVRSGSHIEDVRQQLASLSERPRFAKLGRDSSARRGFPVSPVLGILERPVERRQGSGLVSISIIRR